MELNGKGILVVMTMYYFPGLLAHDLSICRLTVGFLFQLFSTGTACTITVATTILQVPGRSNLEELSCFKERARASNSLYSRTYPVRLLHVG